VYTVTVLWVVGGLCFAFGLGSGFFLGMRYVQSAPYREKWKRWKTQERITNQLANVVNYEMSLKYMAEVRPPSSGRASVVQVRKVGSPKQVLVYISVNLNLKEGQVRIMHGSGLFQSEWFTESDKDVLRATDYLRKVLKEE
jgi:hypothetical protein